MDGDEIQRTLFNTWLNKYLRRCCRRQLAAENVCAFAACAGAKEGKRNFSCFANGI